MKHNRTFVILVSIIALSGAIQIIQTAYHSRWQTRWSALFETAGQIQTTINTLESSAAAPADIATQRESLRITMAEIQSTFKPDLVPKWLQICSGLGLIFGLIGIWKTVKQK